MKDGTTGRSKKKRKKMELLEVRNMLLEIKIQKQKTSDLLNEYHIRLSQRHSE